MVEIRLHEEEYYRKAYGAWLEKNIGGTLGEPVEGRKEQLDLKFYPELPVEFNTIDIAYYPNATDEVSRRRWRTTTSPRSNRLILTPLMDRDDTGDRKLGNFRRYRYSNGPV